MKIHHACSPARLSFPSQGEIEQGEIEQDEIEQGVMNHAPTGAGRPLVKIHHACSPARLSFPS